MKKYKITNETIEFSNKTLHRIKALKDFGDVKKGDCGGFVEKESNLSQDGNAWIYDNAKVFDNAEVYENAQVHENAKVCDNARVYDNAYISGCSWVYGYAQVCGMAKVFENAEVYGNAHVFWNAEISGLSRVNGYAMICEDAKIKSSKDYIVFKNWWSSGRHFTWTRSNDRWIVGCFLGTGEELIKKAYKDSKVSGQEYERIVKYVEEIKKA